MAPPSPPMAVLGLSLTVVQLASATSAAGTAAAPALAGDGRPLMCARSTTSSALEIVSAVERPTSGILHADVGMIPA